MTSVHHFSFTVSDVERSIDFYVGALGFRPPPAVREIRGEWISTMTGFPEARLRIAFVELADVSLELIEYLHPRGAPAVRTTTADAGSAHIAIAVPSIEEAARRLEFFGGKLFSRPVLIPDGAWRGRQVVYVRDPDGIVVELVAGT